LQHLTTLGTGIHGGEDFEVGDELTIGENVAGWVEPATATVTAVGEDGAVTAAEIVDGGTYIGTDPTGTFELGHPVAPPEAAAVAEKQLTDAADKTQGGVEKAGSEVGGASQFANMSTVAVATGACTVASLVVAMAALALRKHTRFSSNESELALQSIHSGGMALTPATHTMVPPLVASC
jgi:hypothetical protein